MQCKSEDMNKKIAPMARNIVYWLLVVLSLEAVDANKEMCLDYPNCICDGTVAVEANCIGRGQIVKIYVLPGVYVNINCENSTFIKYSSLPNFYNTKKNFKSVSFKNCPLPTISFKKVLTVIGVNKTMSLVYQNDKNISQNFKRHHFVGLEDLTKLRISVNGVMFLPDNLFMDLNNLRWLSIRMKSVNISNELFKPLKKLDTLEINHNQMTNMPNNVFEHLTSLKKFSLWQSNISTFPMDFFEGVGELEELDLSLNDLSELPAATFYPLKNLKKLTLFSNKFSVLPENLFSQNKLVSTLIILNNDVKIKELPRNFLRNMPNLEQVHIQRCGIELIYSDIFTNSSRVTNISLAHNEIKNLPEAVFNDQINLLDLDISYNNLENLGLELFSSLTKLDRLNLCCNSITEISGTTFVPLTSLTYLNMERNKLKVISSNLFENNQNRLSISFAFNELDFENKTLINNSWVTQRYSPFNHTFNLRMLNLSHNKLKEVDSYWFLNSHEKVDLSFNYIENLWGIYYKRSSLNSRKALSTEVFIQNNNFTCECSHMGFLEDLQYYRIKIKGEEKGFKHCPPWAQSFHSCYHALAAILSMISFVFNLFLLIFWYIKGKYGEKLSELTKKLGSCLFSDTFNKNEGNKMVIKYCRADEEFVCKEFVPRLRDIKNVKFCVKPMSDVNTIKSFTTMLKRNDSDTCPTLVIFSPNYLMYFYSKVNIKEIHSEMLKAKNTIYIFVDTGPDNSVYAFLKEQRDIRVSVLWNDRYIWDKINDFISKYMTNPKFVGNTKNVQEQNNIA